jgi:hypothetical protein
MKGSEGETPLGLAGYPPLPGGADTGTGETSAATERRIRESRGGYELDPLVDELRTLLALADEVGLRRDAEDAVRPLLALLRFRLEGAP